MSSEVYANGRAVACKAGDSKVIAAFPDVCLSPPSPPTGPIPVPYPDTSFAKDMKAGSKTVSIDGKPVMLKDSSYYQTSPLGNEAATRTLGGSVITHVITGKTYFAAWSMDVKFEGENVDRHLDLTTSNHASKPGSPPQTDLDKAKPGGEDDKCPVCGKAPNPTPKQKPAYLDPPRVPQDGETLIGREGLTVKNKRARVKGARVYSRGNNLVHRDTLHTGQAAEIEVYNSRGTEHQGAMCAHCGTMKPNSKVNNRKCDP